MIQKMVTNDAMIVHGVQVTSLEAYAEVLTHLPDRQRAVFNAIAYLGVASNKEIAEHLGWSINCVTPRVLELRGYALVRCAGYLTDQKTNRKVLAWEVWPHDRDSFDL